MAKKGKTKITSEDLRKMDRAARRQVRLEQGDYRPTVVHRTSKDDLEDKTSNTIDPAEAELQLTEEIETCCLGDEDWFSYHSGCCEESLRDIEAFIAEELND